MIHTLATVNILFLTYANFSDYFPVVLFFKKIACKENQNITMSTDPKEMK